MFFFKSQEFCGFIEKSVPLVSFSTELNNAIKEIKELSVNLVLDSEAVQIGKGTFSKVYRQKANGFFLKGNMGKDKNQYYCVSKAKEKKVGHSYFQENLSIELLGQKNVTSPFVQNFIYHDLKEGIKVSEYANGNNLYEYLRTLPSLTSYKLLYIIAQILLGVKALHSVNLVHRDIKLENVLISTLPNEDGSEKPKMPFVRLADTDAIIEVDQEYGKLKIPANEDDIKWPTYRSSTLENVMKNWNKADDGDSLVTAIAFYNNVNWKDEDCYALGKLLEDIKGFVNQSVPNFFSSHENLRSGLSSLSRNLMAKKQTVEGALKDDFFNLIRCPLDTTYKTEKNIVFSKEAKAAFKKHEAVYGVTGA